MDYIHLILDNGDAPNRMVARCALHIGQHMQHKTTGGKPLSLRAGASPLQAIGQQHKEIRAHDTGPCIVQGKERESLF
jgi:hypothetical protein